MSLRKDLSDHFRISPARSLEDMAMIMAIRAATYMAEQDCPYGEEFDGNDFAGTQIIARQDHEPAGCIRLRYFGNFIKLERLAVMPSYRRQSLARHLIDYAIGFGQDKGFATFCAHVPAHTRLLWQSFGFRPAQADGEAKSAFAFSGYDYCEMHLTAASAQATVGLSSAPLVLIRPEGQWDRPGILETSSSGERTTCDQQRKHHGNIKRSA